MSATAALLLAKTADHIEAVGLNQDGDYFSREDREAGKPVEQWRCCTLGAMSLITSGTVGGGEEFTYTAKYRARLALLGVIQEANPNIQITEWSDTTDPADVVATLRSTAQKLEAEQ